MATSQFKSIAMATSLFKSIVLAVTREQKPVMKICHFSGKVVALHGGLVVQAETKQICSTVSFPDVSMIEWCWLILNWLGLSLRNHQSETPAWEDDLMYRSTWAQSHIDWAQVTYKPRYLRPLHHVLQVRPPPKLSTSPLKMQAADVHMPCLPTCLMGSPIIIFPISTPASWGCMCWFIW